jgi:hypothetical protein
MKLPDWKTWISVLGLIAILTCACRPKEQTNQAASRHASPPPAPATSAPPSAKPTTGLVLFTDCVVADFSLIGALENGEYAKLDALAASLRQSKTAFDNGRWKLAEFYSQISSVPEKSPESEYLKRIKHLQKWSIQKPPSLTADIALSIAYRHYAWLARGGGYADTVTEEAGRLFVERIKMGRNILLSCKERRKECPGWWSALQMFLLAEGCSRQTYDAMLKEALAQEPTYVSFHNSAAYHLLPRWYGEEGDWENYASAAADKVGGEEGDILYARIIWRMQQLHIFGNIFQESKASWARTQKGFEAMRRRNPESLSILTEYCNLAGWGGGRELTRQLFDQIGNRVDLSVWKESTYLTTRDWLYGPAGQ